MQIIKSVSEWRALRQQKRFCDQSIGYVSTMGNLHQGHASLLQRSVAENKLTVLSVFVNPSQFNNASDLQKYPRTLTEDCKLAEDLNVDVVLAPELEQMYPDQYHYQMHEDQISTSLEGQHRPGHFDGMLTVVLKFLLLIKPQRAYFGKKDHQQLRLIQGMAETFFLDIAIIGCDTARDENGLALSSRNNLLSPEQLEQAALFPELLRSNKTPEQITAALTEAGFKVDYITDHNNRRYGAAHLGKVRLIDNIDLTK